jgi:DNA replicative helicase MCM subunit Mcm2 (Cdc46/Mcm family)
MKKELIEEIKELIKVNPNDSIEINEKYLEYFDEEELLDIKNRLLARKENISKISNTFLDEIYEKTKKDEI